MHETRVKVNNNVVASEFWTDLKFHKDVKDVRSSKMKVKGRKLFVVTFDLE